MEGTGSILESILEEEEEDATLNDEDVEMLDAETPHPAPPPPPVPGHPPAFTATAGNGNNKRKNKKKKKNKKNKKWCNNSAPNITDINRFVIDTCRRLKEKKSYLVWNAVGCLGVAAFSDLVKEVDAIQNCGGQMTADGKRLRFGGGILWNILKTREPNAYKEIMTKGREFEKQLWQPKKKQIKTSHETAVSQDRNVPNETAKGVVLDSVESMPEMQQEFEQQPDSTKERIPVRDRIRMPVSYDDLFEEGEIHREPKEGDLTLPNYA